MSSSSAGDSVTPYIPDLDFKFCSISEIEKLIHGQACDLSGVLLFVTFSKKS